MQRWTAPITVPAAKLNLTVMSAAYSVFGVSMLVQPHRWAATPAYRVLLQIFPARTWGVMFLAVGAGMAAGTWKRAPRWLLVAVLMAAFALTTGWMLAFMVRWLSSSSTTPETWVSWAVFDFLLLRTASGMDLPGPVPARPPSPGEVRAILDGAEAAYTEATGRLPGGQDPP